MVGPCAWRTPHILHNMTEDTSGRILWTNESKHYLLRLIRDNPIIISPNVSSDTMMKKDLAWLSIEKCFASDGLVCQLGKIKRLWKRMKDNARQNTMKPNDQRKRGIKHVRPPSDLDWQVHRLLATRNDMIDQQQSASGKSKKKKPSAAQFGGAMQLLPKMPPNITITSQATGWQHPLKHSLVDSDDERMVANGGGGGGGILDPDDCEDGMDDDDDCVDLVDLLTPAQQHQPSRNGCHQQQRHNRHSNHHDALEPVTIIEEMDGGNGVQPKIEPHQDLTLDDDDDEDDADGTANDEYAFHPRHGLQNGVAGNYGHNEDTMMDDATTHSGEQRALQRELLMQDIQLRQLQRQYEDERMANERQLFRKRSQLLDLQILQAGLEMKRLQQQPQTKGDMLMAPASDAEIAAANASNADGDDK